MRAFIKMEIDTNNPGYIIFTENDNKTYKFNIKNLARQNSKFAAIVDDISDPFVLQRTAYHTRIPDSTVSFVKWQNESCDIPVGGFYFDYDMYVAPFLEEM